MMRDDSMLIAAAACLALGWAVRAEAIVWNVNPQGTGDAPTIQAAYDLASAGDVILLAPGTYIDSHTRTIQGYGPGEFPTTTAVAFIKADVHIESSSGAEATIIDGENVRHGFIGADVASAQIRGITFLNCTTTGTFGGTEIWGGGVLTYRSSVVLEDCRFVECRAESPTAGGGGGGVFFAQGSSSEVRRCLFLRGFSSQLGGGIEVFEHTNAVIENNTFVDNSASVYGGAFLANFSSVTVQNNIFFGNEAGQSGGALACLNGSSVAGECNVFWKNDAPVNEHTLACGIVIGQNDNIVQDPLFCDVEEDLYTIDAFSPASPEHPSGRLRTSRSLSNRMWDRFLGS
jgi:hypothetical protein